SRTYAREIQTPEFGRGLDGVLRHRAGDLVGILNGIDLELWDPARDPLLPRRFGSKDVAEGKAACKAALRRECGLADAGRAPLVAVVSRLDPQKGLDLVVESLPRLIERGAQFAALGEGSPELQDDFRRLAARFPASVHLHSGFDEGFAHRVYAAADLFLMPSRFEPCGLGQMIAMRYGALPLASKTGGLADTVREDAGPGLPAPNGFVAAHATAEDLRAALDRALGAYGDPEAWAGRVAAAMACDYSWDRSVDAYEELYRAVAGRAQRA
ncbi:MAG: glycosyltransferase, partial [Elusimicrobia bacterium]|nr:glycosyltransferase [Elusimicrobiota bacterium]